MNCGNCGAPLRPEPGREYFVCDACHSIRHLEPNADGLFVLGSPCEQNCPLCRTPLVDAVILGQGVQHCPNCRGTLLPADILLFLVTHLRLEAGAKPLPPRRIEQAELDRIIHCPLCSRKMDTHPYAGPGNIVIDNCPACEVNWVDSLELRRVATAPDTCLASG